METIDTHPVLRTENLTKRFNGTTAVSDLSLEVNEGEIFGFLGPNGAGKTTSINMICGLLKPDDGKVWIHGKPVRAGEAGGRERVGMCPQENVLWGRLTCLEQMVFVGQMYGLPAKISLQRSEQLLEAMGLQDKRRSLASTLSGGMQRRLNLIMALVHDPEILILDEPEAGLDPQSRILVRDFIRSMARKKTVILTTHNMDEADRVADRVAIIDQGQLLVLDTPKELKKKVGKGDVVEIRLLNGSGDEASLRQKLTGIATNITLDQSSQLIQIRALNAVSHLSNIIEALRDTNFQPDEVNIRANTLEDVFIHLTGRRLRE